MDARTHHTIYVRSSKRHSQPNPSLTTAFPSFMLRMMALLAFPIIIPSVLRHFRLDDLRDNLPNRMLAHIHLPPELRHRVIHDRLAKMTTGLECEPRRSARRADARADTLRDRICGVVDVCYGHEGDGGRGAVGRG